MSLDGYIADKNGGVGWMGGHDAVSYTHLDVYKRQVNILHILPFSSCSIFLSGTQFYLAPTVTWNSRRVYWSRPLRSTVTLIS